MSNEIYPTLPGLEFGVRRSPMWSTAIRTTPSGREFRSGQQLYPRYKRRLVYEFLRTAPALQELQTMEGFFNRHAGQRESFLLDDPDDNSISNQTLGLGNGSTVAWQALRTRGGYTEPIYAVNAVQALTVADWQTAAFPLSAAVRTNLIGRTESYDTSYWVKRLCTVTAGAVASPAGTVTGNKLVETASSGIHGVDRSLALSPSTAYIHSIFAKAGERTQICVNVWGAGVAALSATYDLTTGAYVNGTAAPLSGCVAVGGGWYRVWLGFTTNATAVPVYPQTAIALGGETNYLGDGASGIYVWGSQVEQANGATTPSRYFANSTAAALAQSAPDYTLANGLFTLAVAPPSGATVSWSGTYYWRCRFAADQLDFEKFLDKIWKASQVDLITVKT